MILSILGHILLILNQQEKQIIGECPICSRDLVAGTTVNEHHLIPKSLKGRATITLHKICHSKIHSIFTERELLHHYHTVERLRDHPQMEKFIHWLANKDPEFMDRNRSTNRKKGRRRR